MVKKQLLVLIFILWLQNSSGFLGTLTSIISGVGMVVDFIKTLPSAVHSVKELISSFTSDGSASHGSGASNPLAPIPVSGDPTVTNLTNIMEEYHEEFVQKFKDMDYKLDNLRLFVSDSFEHIEELLQNLPQQIGLMLKKQIMGEFITNINQKWTRIMRFLKDGVDEAVYTHLMTENLQYIDPNLMKFRVTIIPLTELSSTAFGFLTDIATMQKMKILCNGETSHHSVINIFQIIISTEIKAFVLQALAYNEAFNKNRGWRQMLDQSQSELENHLKRYINDLKNALTIEKKPHIRACVSEDSHYHKVIRLTEVEKTRSLVPRNCLIKEQSRPSCTHFENCVTYYDQNSKISDVCDWVRPNMDIAYTIWGAKCTCLHYEKFILTLMQSRVHHNYVVVAVRFQKKDNYIYIQIAEGKLESNAYISNFAWILPTQKRNGEDPFEASLTVAEGKTIALDDVQLPPRYILTGIKFSPQPVSGDDGFKIGVYGVKFHYETGKLDPMDEVFVLVPDLPRDKSQVSTTQKDRHSFQYTLAEFRISNYVHSNSPRTLPELNAADVLPNPLSPIGGVGIFYEIAGNKTACLSLRLFPIDYMIFIESVENFNFNSLGFHN